MWVANKFLPLTCAARVEAMTRGWVSWGANKSIKLESNFPDSQE